MLLQQLCDRGFDIRCESHAAAILEKDFPVALDELENVLESVQVPVTEIIGSGGGETKGTQRLRRALTQMGWRKGKFEIRKTIKRNRAPVDISRDRSRERAQWQPFGPRNRME